MSGAITAAVAVGIGAAGLLYTIDQNQKNKSAADEALKTKKQADMNDKAFLDKKKQNNDILAANNSLRLRGAGGSNGMNIDPATIKQGTGTSGGGSNPNAIGLAGGGEIDQSLLRFNNNILGRF